MSTITHVWSEEQARIFDFIVGEEGNAVVTAVAGSGKTTTIVEAANRLPNTLLTSAKFVAFSKRIQLTLEDRLPREGMAQTLHSMGYRGWNAMDPLRGSVPTEVTKVRKILDDIVPRQLQRDYKWGVEKLVSIAKQSGLVPQQVNAPVVMMEDNEENWEDLMDFYDIYFPRTASRERAIEFARRALIASIRQANQVVDFDDMIYLPVIFHAPLPQHQILFVDEAQDVNAIQRVMLHRALKPEGRLIAVGDKCQAIFGFRGADVYSIENIRKEFEAVELPLSVCYRCDLEIIAMAQRYMPHIQPGPQTESGVVDSLESWDYRTFKASDVVLCRNTAPLVDLAYSMIRGGVGATVLGRDIAKGLVSLVRSLRARSMTELSTYLRGYEENEVRRFYEEGKEYKAAQVQDRCATLRVFIDGAKPGQTVDGVIAEIEEIFTDEGEKRHVTTLSTIHKAKGLEWPRVYVLDWHLLPSRFARQDWQIEQERNLAYVAITRAQHELYFISTE